MSWFPGAVVGADAPGVSSVNAGAGVDAIISLGKSKGMLDDLSPLSKGVVWSGSFAMSQLAHGNTALAVGAAAGTILAATSYYVASLISEGFTKAVATTAAQAASAVSEIIPIIGPIASTIIGVISTYGWKPSGGNALIAAEECKREVFQVVVGSGPQNQILPADLFMGPSENAYGERRGDAFEQWGYRQPQNHTALAELLIELENPAPPSKWVKLIWPKAGMSPETRGVLSQLRRGISSLYVNPLTGQHWTPDVQTDGGSALWVPYIDILNREWRAGRINAQWLQWRQIELETKFDTGNLRKAGEHYLMGIAAKASNPLQWAAAASLPNGYFNAPCVFFDDRAVRKVELMVDGWQKLIASPYSQFQGELADAWQAGDNPLHGPPTKEKSRPIKVPKKSTSVAPFAAILGTAAAALVISNPAVAAAAYRRIRSTATSVVKKVRAL